MGLFSFLGCKKEKPEIQNFDTWLEKTYNGQIIRLGNIVDLHPRRLFDKKARSILADKQDTLVQMVISRNDDLPDFGIDTSELREQWGRRKSETAEAREFRKLLPLSSLPQATVGYIETSLYLLLYENPSLENRKEITNTLNNWLENGEKKPEQVFVEIMDTSSERIGDIVPYGYWHDGSNRRSNNTLATLFFRIDQLEDSDKVDWENWILNTDANAMSGYLNSIRTAVEKYVEDKKMNVILKMDEGIGYSENPDWGMSFRFAVPYFKEGSEEAIGEIMGLYDYDSNSVKELEVKQVD